MLVALLLFGSAQAKAPDLAAWQQLSVAYKMSTKGTLACETTYEGTGKAVVSESGRATFEGTWKIVEDTCAGATVWTPKDGVAFHTLRLGADGKHLDEWVVHSRAEHHERFRTKIQEQGQYWINELEADVPRSGEVVYTHTENRGMPGVKIEISHELKLTLAREPAAE